MLLLKEIQAHPYQIIAMSGSMAYGITKMAHRHIQQPAAGRRIIKAGGLKIPVDGIHVLSGRRLMENGITF